jgi:hypothetical protein
MADGLLSASDYQQEQLMKSMCLAALTGALAISTMALAIDVASAATRYGVYRGGVNRVGVAGVGVARVGVARVGVGRVGIGYGGAGVGYGRWAGYRPGYGLGYRRYGLGAAAVAGAAVGAGYYAGGAYGAYDAYASGGYDAYASGDANAVYVSSDVGTSDAYILHGTYISETDAVAYCAQQFRSYDIASRTYLAYSGERVSCPQ